MNYREIIQGSWSILFPTTAIRWRQMGQNCFFDQCLSNTTNCVRLLLSRVFGKTLAISTSLDHNGYDDAVDTCFVV